MYPSLIHLRPTSKQGHFVRMVLTRWRLAIYALPIAVFAMLMRAVYWNSLMVPGRFPLQLDASTVGPIIAAATFVCTFLVNGALQDFKESEKMPSDVESAFQNILAAIILGARVQGFNPRSPLNDLRSCL